MVFLDWAGDFFAQRLPSASSFANGKSRRVTARLLFFHVVVRKTVHIHEQGGFV
jgi:hypothetical protein